MAGAARPLPDISQIELIMTQIFQHLNTQDLESCRQAFGYWERYIATERRIRQEVYPFLWTWFCNVHGEMHYCHHKHENPRSIHDDIRMKVGKYASRRCVPLLFCARRVVDDAETLFPDIQPTVITDEYRHLIEPFNVDNWRSPEVKRVRWELRQLVIKALRTNFSRSPQIIVSAHYDLMGCGEDLKLKHLKDRHAFAGFIIPQYPGFEIHNFEISYEKNFSLIPVNANIKGLLVFSDCAITFNRVMRLVHRRRIYEIAIGAYLTIESEVARNGSIVAFCGENVETASLVVSPSNKEAAERKLRLFRETGLLENKCFAFVFNCRSLESNVYEELAKTFTRLYPDVPLVGLSSVTTFGVDYLPGASEEIKSLYLHHLLKKDRVGYAYEDKSVFVLVSIKP